MADTRICYKESYGIVRWIGNISGKDGKWLGIEWDDLSKGKHSGCYEGVQYFVTRFPGHGSFLKEPVFLEGKVQGRGISAAIFDKYADKTVQDLSECYVPTIKNSKKPIELVGAEKVLKKQEQVSNIKEIALQSCYISEIEEGFGSHLLSCEILLLDQNLLYSWNQVSTLLIELPQLQTLSLASNRIESALTNPVSHSLLILVLNNMALQWPSVVPILHQFPSLQELHLYKNFCNQFTVLPGSLDSLKLLNLEDNQITNWEELINNCNNIPKLEKLIINSNPIGSIVYTGGLNKLAAISIENCNINDWNSVDELSKFQSGLKEVRISRNPGIQSGMSISIFRFNVIARIGTLNMLSGSAVRPQERIEAERYYLRLHIDNPSVINSTRWNELVSKHGAPSEISCKVVSEKDSLAQQTLNSNTVTVLLRSIAKNSAGKEYTKKLFLNMNVADLKTMCSKLFGLKSNEMKLSFREKGTIMPEILEDTLKPIGYYILTDNGEIWVEDL